jgi:hypothetical protein
MSKQQSDAFKVTVHTNITLSLEEATALKKYTIENYVALAAYFAELIRKDLREKGLI